MDQITRLSWAIGGVMLLETPVIILYSSPLLAFLGFVFGPQPLLRFLLDCCRSGDVNYVVVSFITTGFMFLQFAGSVVNGVGGALRTWAELIRSAGGLYAPFLLFALQNDGRGVEVVERVMNGLITMLLPGSLLDTVVRSSKYGTVVLIYCFYFLLVGCTVAAAARRDLDAARTTLAHLSAASCLSLVALSVRFYLHPVVTSSHLLSYLLFIAAVPAATRVLHANGLVKLETIMIVSLGLRDLMWYANLLGVMMKIL